jgi:transcriptional regulator with XRE-family HTH domain
MTTRVRRIDRARWLARRALNAIGDELREARLVAELPQRRVGEIVGISAAEVSRIELGQSPHVPYETLVVIAAAVGLDLPLRAFPNGDPVRDAAQLALLARLWARLPPGTRHRTEVPIGIGRDQRSWDAVVEGPGWILPVEAEARLRDVQSLLRRLALKQRDAGVDRVLLLVADTRHNRSVLRFAEAEFTMAFPERGRDSLRALDAGEQPAGSAVVLL